MTAILKSTTICAYFICCNLLFLQYESEEYEQPQNGPVGFGETDCENNLAGFPHDCRLAPSICHTLSCYNPIRWKLVSLCVFLLYEHAVIPAGEE